MCCVLPNPRANGMFDIVLVFSTSIFSYIEVMVSMQVMAVILVCSFIGVDIEVNIGT